MPKILVVDDTAVDRRLAGGLLEKTNFLDVEYAGDGAEALEVMSKSLPDVVVTDLQMPNMDGLELVTRIRLLHPEVPVILITARGSESLAMEALERGAASYVPKADLADKLVETVEELIAIASSTRMYNKLMECQTRIEFSYQLDNDVALIDALVDLVQQMIDGMKLCDHTGKFRVGVALREALLNALYRGNLEITFQEMQESREHLLDGERPSLVQQRLAEAPYRDRHVYVDAAITLDEARFTIRDEGPGFDHRAANTGGLDSPAALDASSGRGLNLIRSFMDEVSFSEAGNEVTLVKRREQPAG